VVKEDDVPCRGEKLTSRIFGAENGRVYQDWQGTQGATNGNEKP